ncbi:MAG: N-acetyl sugar amidotransferase, partial [Planctomycetota bacterium]
MPDPRLIPCLLLKHGLLVRSERFRVHQVIGNPISTVDRLSHWNVDELVVLDISPQECHDLRRDDLNVRYGGRSALDVLGAIADVCCMPLAFGGGIRSIEDVERRLAAGADKCVINTMAVDAPDLITDAARRFGSQCIVVSIDARREGDAWRAFVDGGRRDSGRSADALARTVEDLGAGEIFLNSIDRDGTANGYDLDLVRSVTGAVTIPVVACGGVGSYTDFAPAITEGGASAAAAANIFHFYELTYPLAKRACLAAGVHMRDVGLGSRWFVREPRSTPDVAAAVVARRRRDAATPLPDDTPPPAPIRWCARCLYPSMSAGPMEFDDTGVCMGCRQSELKVDLGDAEWARRRNLLVDLLAKGRSRDGSRHDCVIGVSGGKDSYFQVHYVKNVLGFNPLLVTYDTNNWSDLGWANMRRMREVFDVDHVVCSPSVATLKTLNRLGFIVMGDMSWHCHVGIHTAPMQVAAQHGIPTVIWGEHGFMDLSGQYSMRDFPELSYRERLEFDGRGYEWTYFEGVDGLTARDLIPYQYPTDRALDDLALRSIYLGNYIPWEANDHVRLVMDAYGWQPPTEPFDRTYR